MNSKQELDKLSRSMAAQDNRGTQLPLFVVMEDVKRYTVYSDDWEFRERADNDEPLCTSCVALSEAGLELPIDCDDCDFDCFNYYNAEEGVNVTAGIFFTAAGCDRHIEENKHHYNNGRSYAVSAWRNDEMKLVMQDLVARTQPEMPSHYL